MALIQNLNTEDGDLLKNLIENIEKINEKGVSVEEMENYVSENPAPGGGIANLNEFIEMIVTTTTTIKPSLIASNAYLTDYLHFNDQSTKTFYSPVVDEQPLFFSDFDFILEISSLDDDTFTVNPQVINFGKDRGITPTNLTLNDYGTSGLRYIKAYYQAKDYPSESVTYKSIASVWYFEITQANGG